MKKPKWSYGLFNPVRYDPFSTRVQTNSNTNAFAYSRKVVEEVLISPTIKPTGNYTGIVLKKMTDGKPNLSVMDKINKFVTEVGVGLGPPITNIKMARVRVPEIHSMIPEPEDFSDPKVDLHHAFEYDATEFSDLEVGNLVTVSFYDAEGVFVPRIIASSKNKVPVGEPVSKPKEAYEKMPEDPSRPKAPVVYGPPAPIRYKDGDTTVDILPAVPFRNNRVRITDDGFSVLPANSPLLVPVPTRPGYSPQKMHILAAKRFEKLREAAAAAGFEIYASSGFRPPGYKSYEEYEQTLRKMYIQGSTDDKFKIEAIMSKKGVSKTRAEEIALREAKKMKAFSSAHSTGLAVDVYWEGFSKGEVDVAASQPGGMRTIKLPDGREKKARGNLYGSATNYYQWQTSFIKWMSKNAHLYGFSPLLPAPGRIKKDGTEWMGEAWHWEVHVPLENYHSGTDFVIGENYAVRIKEASSRNGTLTSNKGFSI